MRAPAERSSGLDFNIKITSYEGVTISVNKPNSGSANLQYINKTLVHDKTFAGPTLASI